MSSAASDYPSLHRAVFELHAIDNHAHPILKEEHRDKFPFEGLVSEAQGSALTSDSIHTVASLRATKELIGLYGLDASTTWDDLKKHRQALPYTELTEACFKPAKIKCLLLDDGLEGIADLAEGVQAHDRHTTSPTKRVVRIEVVAEVCTPFGPPTSLLHPCELGAMQRIGVFTS